MTTPAQAMEQPHLQLVGSIPSNKDAVFLLMMETWSHIQSDRIAAESKFYKSWHCFLEWKPPSIKKHKAWGVEDSLGQWLSKVYWRSGV